MNDYNFEKFLIYKNSIVEYRFPILYVGLFSTPICFAEFFIIQKIYYILSRLKASSISRDYKHKNYNFKIKMKFFDPCVKHGADTFLSDHYLYRRVDLPN